MGPEVLLNEAGIVLLNDNSSGIFVGGVSDLSVSGIVVEGHALVDGAVVLGHAGIPGEGYDSLVGQESPEGVLEVVNGGTRESGCVAGLNTSVEVVTIRNLLTLGEVKGAVGNQLGCEVSWRGLVFARDLLHQAVNVGADFGMEEDIGILNVGRVGLFILEVSTIHLEVVRQIGDGEGSLTETLLFRCLGQKSVHEGGGRGSES